MEKSPKERRFSFHTEKRDQEIKLANGSFEIERKVLFQILQLMYATHCYQLLWIFKFVPVQKHQLDKLLKEEC